MDRRADVLPVFISCSSAQEDLGLLAELDKHLLPLERQSLLCCFHRGRLRAGEDVEQRLSAELSSARLILLLVSVDFLGDDACWRQSEQAMERREAGEAQVIPVLLHPCEWKETPFDRLKPLPDNGEWVSTSPNRQLVWTEVSRAVRAHAEALRQSALAATPGAEPASAAPGGSSARQSDPGGEPWNPLLERVVRVLQLREAQQGHRMRLVPEPAPPPFHQYIEVSSIARLGHTPTFALGAIPGEPTEAIVEIFRSQVHARYGQPGSGVHSTLVYGGDRAPPALVRRARAGGIRLVSLLEYEELIDFSSYLQRQTARLAVDPVYPPSLFVPQRFRYTLGLEEREAVDALATLDEWLGSDHGRLVLVLGEFGTGKTFLLHELARRLGERGGPLTPVLIELRALEKARAFDALVAQHLTLEGMQHIDLRSFRYMLGAGRIALLFDGFDELALRVTYDRAAEHFDTVLDPATENAKIVLTSRSQHFLSDRQIRTALGERALSKGFRMVKLERFNQAQIRRFLVQRFGIEDTADQRLRLLEQVRDLMGLSEIPRMLSFIAEIEETKLLEARDQAGEITAARLYQILLDRWLGYEFERAHPKGALPGLSLPQRWRAATELAVMLWRRTERTIRITELPESAHASIKALAAPEHPGGTPALEAGVITHQVGSGTLLRRDEGDNFSFLHHSVLEWLVARAAADEVNTGGASSLLAAADMSPLMAEFFVALATRDRAIAWARGVLEVQGAGDAVIKNALLVLERLGVEVRRALNLAGQDLRGQDLSGRDLSRTDLTGADLTEARLVGARLDGASLRGARLVRADLSEASAVGASFDEADLSMARLLGADLRAARFKGARLVMVKLIGAKLDAGAIPERDLALAAPPFPPRVEVCAESPGARCAAVAFSPEGSLVASGHVDGSVRLWDAHSGHPITTLLGHEDEVHSVAFSPDGRMLASGSADRTLRLWDHPSCQLLQTLRAHKGAVTSVTFSPDSRVVVSGSKDRTVRLSYARSGRLLHELLGHDAGVTSVAFSPEGRMVASASSDKTVRLWDTSSGLPLRVLQGHRGTVMSVAISPDGQTIASGGEDRVVHLHDPGSGVGMRALHGHTAPVASLAFSADSQVVASASDDATVRLWEVASSRELNVLRGHWNSVESVAFSPGGQLVVSGSKDRTVRLWEAASGQTLVVAQGARALATSVAFSPDGRTLALGGSDRTLQLWDVRTCREVTLLRGHKDWIRSVAFNPNSQLVGSAGDDGAVRLWRVRSGELLHELKVVHGHAQSVVFSPDGRSVALAGTDHLLALWHYEGNRPLRPMHGHESSVTSLAFNPAGDKLASGGYDRTVRLWYAATGRQLPLIKGHQDVVTSVAFSPDGLLIASGSRDRTVRLCEVSSSSAKRVLSCDAAIKSVAFCPTRNPQDWLIAAGTSDGSVVLWDRDMEKPRPLRGHQASVASVAFSPDGRLLASASHDGTARLWSVATHTCLAVLLPRSDGWAAFTPDGRFKLGGDIQGAFWHLVGLCRFEPGELDSYLPEPLRVPDDQPLFTLPPDPS